MATGSDQLSFSTNMPMSCAEDIDQCIIYMSVKTKLKLVKLRGSVEIQTSILILFSFLFD